MFLKRFKEKSNQKYMNELLAARKVAVNNTKVTSVGVILNTEEFNDLEAFRKFFKQIDIKENKTKIVSLIADEKMIPNNWDSFFYPKQFGWNGKINNIDLQEFINTPFDVLISFYSKNTVELNLVTTVSKANFKIGITNEDSRLFDLIIYTKTNNLKIFTSEVVKYLTRLNKL
jgi:hypothetical protein